MIKKLEISGTSSGTTIKEILATSASLKIKKPVKITHNISGSVSYEGNNSKYIQFRSNKRQRVNRNLHVAAFLLRIAVV